LPSWEPPRLVSRVQETLTAEGHLYPRQCSKACVERVETLHHAQEDLAEKAGDREEAEGCIEDREVVQDSQVEATAEEESDMAQSWVEGVASAQVHRVLETLRDRLS
jgi:hypothetical protein